MAGLKNMHLPEPGNDRFDSIDPLDSRYYDAATARYLSERSRIAYQAYVEAAVAHTLADYGVCSRKNADAIEVASTKVTAEAVYEEELTTRHDIKALVNCIKKLAGPEAAPYVHFGATSYDIIATASVLQMRAAVLELVVPRLKKLLGMLIDLSERYADTVQIGRTHGQHAVPVTFGFAISEYVSRLGESTVAIEDLTGMLRGKFSGAVGAYNALGMFVPDPMAFEKSLLAKLGLQPAPYSTQILPPDPMVRLIDELTIAAGIMANLSTDMRHLQRSEIAEVRERFVPGQTGSSTMAHKRNPWNFENVVSMSKQVIAQSVNANLNLTSEHQRDLTDSASSRFYGVVPACVAAMAKRLDAVMGKLEVDTEAMQRNMRASGGAIAAEPLYLLFTKYGHASAHELAKELSQAALDRHATLQEVIMQHDSAAGYWRRFSKREQEVIKHPEKHYTGLAAQRARLIVKQYEKLTKAKT
jgi:adenylosuccinate lyase